MKIGISGPVTLGLLDFDFKGVKIPLNHSFPLISYLINGLMKRGHQVVVYSSSGSITEPFVFENPKLTICLAREFQHPGRNFFKYQREDLINLMRAYPADIVNAHWSYEYGWAAVDSGLPAVVTVRDHATTILKLQFHPYRIMRWMMNYTVLNRANYLTTNSAYLKLMLTKKQQQKTTVISNFYPRNLEQHYIPIDKKSHYIVSVNNGYNNRKNVDNGLRAFALIRKRFPDLHYHLIGADMQEGGPAHEFAIANKLTDGVAFLGHKSFLAVVEATKNAKLLLHTSREESFGNVVLEAMVMGTPVVGGEKSGNIPYLLDYGKAGILCDVNSPASIADAVTKMVEKDTSLRYEKQAYVYATQNFSEDIIIDKYVSEYEKILSLK